MGQSARELSIETPSWQEELANSFQNLEDLLDYLNLDQHALRASGGRDGVFPFKVTRSFAAKIEKGNPEDPLLKQILPSVHEFDISEGFSDDPVGDLNAVGGTGLLHKYAGRVLLIATGACAVNCRYCFRRNFPYSGNQLSNSARAEALHYIASRPDIREVILSGGDPLVMNNPNLENLIRAIAKIDHVERLRIHTRIVSVLPARIDCGLIRILKTCGLKTVVVTHINHAREIDESARAAVSRLLTANIRVLNQAVLLKGVNDDLQTLRDLFENAFDSGIQPYYLHLLDRASGTQHFEVPETECIALEEGLRSSLPGYLLPRFVREIEGSAFKVPLGNR